MATPSQVQSLYLAFFDRPADVSGLDYWTASSKLIQPLKQITAGFATTREYANSIAGLTAAEVIDRFYWNLFGRQRDVSENYWLLEVVNNRQTLDQVAYAIAQGALAQPSGSRDRTVMEAKLAAAEQWTAALRVDSTASAKYVGAEAAVIGADYLDSVLGPGSIPSAAQVRLDVAFLGRTDPLLGSINLSPDPSKPTTEQFQTEITTAVAIGSKLFGLSSGGGLTLQETDLTNPAAIVLEERVALEGYTSQSVASFGSLVVAALSPVDYATNGGQGLVRFYRMDADGSLKFLKDVLVGFLPDALAFSEDGTQVVVANEGEPTPNYTVDRPGSIGIIKILGSLGEERFTYTDLGFSEVELPTGLRISGPPGTTKSTDLEPENIAILGDHAYVTLQENNGVVVVDLKTSRIEKIYALGAVDFFNQLVDLSDKDGPDSTPVFAPKLGQPFEGLRQPDGIAAYQANGNTYFVTANEGDGRDYGNFVDEVRGTGSDRVKRLTDDGFVGSPDRTTIFGGRSISIFNAETGRLVWDSGNTLQTIAVAAGVYDVTRSDDKGVEPEGIVVTELFGRTYAIVGLERTKSSMVVVFDVSDPSAPRFVTSRVIKGSISPEGLYIVDPAQSPTGRQMLVVSNEITNTLDVFDLPSLVAAAPAAGAGTFKPTMLQDVPGGPVLTINSLLTVGEFTEGLGAGTPVYAPPGIPDGMGAYDNGDGTYTLLVNHELSAGVGYANQVWYAANEVDAPVAINIAGARISRFIVDKDIDDNAANGYQSKIISGGLAYTKIIGSDNNGFERFCSSTFFEAAQFGGGRGFRDAIYITGEENNGSLYVLDPVTSVLREAPALGKGSWENVALVDTGNVNTVGLVLFDDTKAPLYLWVGIKNIVGDLLDRNGLSNGNLYAWKPNEGVIPEAGSDATPGLDSDDLKAIATGIPLSGGWVFLGNQDYVTGKTASQLRTAAVAAGAMQFSRPEDGDTNPTNGKLVAFNTTGSADFGSGDKYGNVLTLDFTAAFAVDGQLQGAGSTVLKPIYDGDKLTDPTTGLKSPDNLVWSADGHLYVQEDRSVTPWGTQDGSIWKLNPNQIDPVTGQASAERWAVIQRQTPYGQTDSFPGESGLGEWESSGIIDYSKIYNASPGTYFGVDVQAHGLKDGNIWGANYLAEGGQIMMIKQEPVLAGI